MEGTWRTEMITLYPLVVHQVINLNTPMLQDRSKRPSFDEVGSPLIKGEIDHDTLLFILFDKIRASG